MILATLLTSPLLAQVPVALVTGSMPAAAHGDPGRNSQLNSNGNVLGGIRLAEHAVPTATNTGINSGDSICRLYGSHEPFVLDTLKTLYPNPESYISAVRRVVEQNLSDGFILPVDAQQTIRQAESSAIGRWQFAC